MPTVSSSGRVPPTRETQLRRSLSRVMRWDSALDAELVEQLWRDPEALAASGQPLHAKPSCTVLHIELPAGSFVMKRYAGAGPRRLRRAAWSRSPAHKAWVDGLFLHEAGLPTVRPRACVERRIGPFKAASYLLCDYIAGVSLYRFMRFAHPTAETVTRLAQQAAAIWQRLDELRVCHNDFKTENLLVDPAEKVWLIDVDRMIRCRDVEETRRRQIRDAGDFLHGRNWRSDPGAAEAFRREILRTPAAIEALAGPRANGHPLTRPAPQTNRPSHLVTVLIPTRNSAATIRACLESVHDMADEIIVADAGSTDGTLEEVRNFGGCRVLERRGADAGALEAWAAHHARRTWVLRILPSERLNPELGRQVQDLLASEPAEHGFYISRAAYFQGRRLKHGGFDWEWSIRLFRRDAGRYEICNGQVEVRIPTRKVGRIAAKLLCEVCPSVEQAVLEMLRRASRSAEQGRRAGRRPGTFAAVGRPAGRFLSSYVLRGGFLDGVAGLHACCLSAAASYLEVATNWEIARHIDRSRHAAAKTIGVERSKRDAA